MPTTTRTAPLLYSSVDQLLGSRHTRFFGEGFKRVGHRLGDIAVRPGHGGQAVTATAGLALPRDWSRKGVDEQPPHLSTIDAMLFSAQLAGLYLAHTHGLGAEDGFGVRSAVLKAGKAPQETGLDRFGVSAAVLGTEARQGGLRSEFDCLVGILAVRLTVDHGGSPAALRGDRRYDDAGELPGPWNGAPYGADHRKRTQLLTGVEVDRYALTAAADLAISGGGNAGPTMVDLFVSALQLGQVLLYGLDSIARADSDTLWMRRTVIDRTDDAADGRLTVRLEAERLLEAATGTWRGADVVAAHAGVELRCTVAHRLPHAR